MQKLNELKQKAKETINLLGQFIQEANDVSETNYENSLPIENFWMELTNTSNGKQKLSTLIQGKHWVGFLETRDKTSKDGESYSSTSANMRLCNWDKCRICDRSDNRNIMDNFFNHHEK